MEIFIIIWLMCGFGAMAIANQRGGSGCGGFALGVLLGPLGILFAFMVFNGKKCPTCQKTVGEDAVKCPHCHSTFGPQSDGGLTPWYSCPACKKGPLSRLSVSCPDCGAVFKEQEQAQKKCPDCAEMIKVEARKCRYCGKEFQ